ncbi:MAG: ParA family protein [Lacticaseibacillus paracasei]
MGKVIALSSNKGGILKTSLSVNLSGTLATHGKKVLLIDIDNQGNIATTFGLDPDDIEFTIYDLLVKNPELANPDLALNKVSNNIDIIVANDDMAYFEIDVLTDTEHYPKYFELLRDVVSLFKAKYDYIIVDTPPQMGLIAANVFYAVQDVIIPFQPEEYAFRSLVKSVSAIDKFKKVNKELQVKEIVPVKVKRTVMHQAYLDSAKSYAKARNLQFSNIIIKDSIKYAEMVARMNIPVTLFDDVPKTLMPYKKVYTELAKELGYIG